MNDLVPYASASRIDSLLMESTHDSYCSEDGDELFHEYDRQKPSNVSYKVPSIDSPTVFSKKDTSDVCGDMNTESILNREDRDFSEVTIEDHILDDQSDQASFTKASIFTSSHVPNEIKSNGSVPNCSEKTALARVGSRQSAMSVDFPVISAAEILSAGSSDAMRSDASHAVNVDSRLFGTIENSEYIVSDYDNTIRNQMTNTVDRAEISLESRNFSSGHESEIQQISNSVSMGLNIPQECISQKFSPRSVNEKKGTNVCDNIHTCTLCNKQYRHISSLKNHMRKHDSDLLASKRFRCPCCQYSSQYKRNVSKHIHASHPNPDVLFPISQNRRQNDHTAYMGRNPAESYMHQNVSPVNNLSGGHMLPNYASNYTDCRRNVSEQRNQQVILNSMNQISQSNYFHQPLHGFGANATYNRNSTNRMPYYCNSTWDSGQNSKEELAPYIYEYHNDMSLFNSCQITHRMPSDSHQLDQKPSIDQQFCETGDFSNLPAAGYANNIINERQLTQPFYESDQQPTIEINPHSQYPDVYSFPGPNFNESGKQESTHLFVNVPKHRPGGLIGSRGHRKRPSSSSPLTDTPLMHRAEFCSDFDSSKQKSTRDVYLERLKCIVGSERPDKLSNSPSHKISPLDIVYSAAVNDQTYYDPVNASLIQNQSNNVVDELQDDSTLVSTCLPDTESLNQGPMNSETDAFFSDLEEILARDGPSQDDSSLPQPQSTGPDSVEHKEESHQSTEIYTVKSPFSGQKQTTGNSLMSGDSGLESWSSSSSCSAGQSNIHSWGHPENISYPKSSPQATTPQTSSTNTGFMESDDPVPFFPPNQTATRLSGDPLASFTESGLYDPTPEQMVQAEHSLESSSNIHQPVSTSALANSNLQPDVRYGVNFYPSSSNYPLPQHSQAVHQVPALSMECAVRYSTNPSASVYDHNAYTYRKRPPIQCQNDSTQAAALDSGGLRLYGQKITPDFNYGYTERPMASQREYTKPYAFATQQQPFRPTAHANAHAFKTIKGQIPYQTSLNLMSRDPCTPDNSQRRLHASMSSTVNNDSTFIPSVDGRVVYPQQYTYPTAHVYNSGLNGKPGWADSTVYNPSQSAHKLYPGSVYNPEGHLNKYQAYARQYLQFPHHLHSSSVMNSRYHTNTTPNPTLVQSQHPVQSSVDPLVFPPQLESYQTDGCAPPNFQSSELVADYTIPQPYESPAIINPHLPLSSSKPEGTFPSNDPCNINRNPSMLKSTGEITADDHNSPFAGSLSGNPSDVYARATRLVKNETTSEEKMNIPVLNCHSIRQSTDPMTLQG